jgi:DNA-binding transcriptional LysR family regulator
MVESERYLMSEIRQPRHAYDDHIKLRHLRIIAAIERHKGISAAAAALGVSPAAVSKAVGEVETTIGIELFERQGRGVRLTAAGQLFVSTAQIVTKEFSVLENEIRLMRTGEVGSLRIGVQAVATEQLMAKAVARFKARHPRALVQMIDGVLATLLVDLRAGKFDLVVGRMIPEMLSLDLEGLPLMNDCYVAVTSRHIEGGEDLADWKQALNMLWCLPPAGTPVTNAFAAFVANHNLPYPDRLIETRSMHFIYALMKEMPLCALVPASLVETWQKQIAIRKTALPLDLPLKPLGLIWSKKLATSPAAVAFRTVVAELAGEIAGTDSSPHI